MNAIVQKDKRCDIDKRYDKMWNDLCRNAKLTARQSTLVSFYLRELLTLRIHEVESARDTNCLTCLAHALTAKGYRKASEVVDEIKNSILEGSAKIESDNSDALYGAKFAIEKVVLPIIEAIENKYTEGVK